MAGILPSTEPVRIAIRHAQDQARQAGDTQVQTEHLLLGLLLGQDSRLMRLLSRLGFSARELRAAVEQQLTRGSGSPGLDVPLAQRTRHILNLAEEEALDLDHSAVGPEHLLLGLTRERDTPAGKILARLGADLTKMRGAVGALGDPGADL